MSRRKKAPEERLIELVDEIGMNAVESSLRVMRLCLDDDDLVRPKQSPSPRPKTQPRAVSASKKANPEEKKEQP